MLRKVVFPLAMRQGEGMVELEGARFLIDVRNPPEEALFVWREYEVDVWTAVRGALRPGMVAVDIGANSGVITVLMRARVGASGRVVSVDPSPAACARVLEQLAANDFENVDVECVAVGSTARSIRYFEASVGIGALPVADAAFACGQSVDVQELPLDSLLAGLCPVRVDLLKIDTDGSELEVLRGARQTLEDHRPIVLFEVNAPGLARRGTSDEELLAYVVDAGYEVLRAEFAAGSRMLARPPQLLGFRPAADLPPPPPVWNALAVDPNSPSHRGVAEPLAG